MATLLRALPPSRAEQSRWPRAQTAFLVSILLLAVVLRVAERVHSGGADFWTNGYSLFYDLANNLVHGKGLGLDGGSRAMRMPAYPLFLALTTLAGKSYLCIAVAQALMGAGTALCAYLIGRDLFGDGTGLVAASMTALYPYYIVHDTALQETGMFTFLTALAVFALLRARRSQRWMVWASAGFCLGAALLTRQTLAPFAVAAIVWMGMWGGQARFRRCATVALAFALTVGPWLVRNALAIGSPVLTSETGRQLWNGNNAKTFSHYPGESIDRSAEEAFDAFTAQDWRELDSFGGNEIAESHWFLKKGIAYIEAHPAATLRAASRKIQAAFSWRFNPVREPLVQAVYQVSYTPILVLGVLGMALAWRRSKELSLIYLLFVTFAAVTAIFFAHTSHRSYLDVYLIVFSAHALQRIARRTIPSRWYRLSTVGTCPQATSLA